MIKKIGAIGDIHGDYERLRALLIKHGVISIDNKWIAEDRTFVCTGDITNRLYGGINVILLFMKLEKEATEAGGRFVSLCGNHDALILARAYGFLGDDDGRSCHNFFEQIGGFWIEAHTIAMDEKILEWMKNRPLMHREGENLFQHADTCDFYNSFGNTIEEINQNGINLLSTAAGAIEMFARMCNCRFWDSDEQEWQNCENTKIKIESYMEKFEVKNIFHGHTAFTGSSPLVSFGGKICNLDGSLSAAYSEDPNRGFIIEIDQFSKCYYVQ